MLEFLEQLGRKFYFCFLSKSQSLEVIQEEVELEALLFVRELFEKHPHYVLSGNHPNFFLDFYDFHIRIKIWRLPDRKWHGSLDCYHSAYQDANFYPNIGREAVSFVINNTGIAEYFYLGHKFD